MTAPKMPDRHKPCPHCGARDCRIVDPIWVDGVPFDAEGYCGVCGKNWPQPKDKS